MPYPPPITAALFMDNQDQNLGNSPGDDGRGRLHVKVANSSGEAIPVVVISTPAGTTNVNEFNEIIAAPSGSESTILSYTVPASKTLSLDRIEVGGTNIATFNVYIDSALIARVRTFFGSQLTTTIDFTSPTLSVQMNAGQVIDVKVDNFRPMSGDFESRLQGTLA